jgi:DNA-binding MarR family transcriptional regulator
MSDALMSDAAHRSWRAMRALVLDHDHRKEVCDALDMSFVRIKALLALAGEPMTMRELATRLSTDPPYTTLIVDDLEARKLLVRTVHPTDRRAKTVAVTPAGQDAARRAERMLNEPPAALRALSTEQLHTLDQTLTQLTRIGA